MPASVAILTRKVLLDDSALTWISEVMNWAGYKQADLYLQVHGCAADNSISLVVEGASEPGENATWTTLSAPASFADSSALTDVGRNRYIRQNLYPYTRVKVNIVGTGTLKAAEVSVTGQLHEENA